MKAVFVRGCTLLMAASLAGCATTGGGGNAGGIEVTTSHLNQQIARAQIAVEPFEAADANLPEFRNYAASVASQLARLGWTVVTTTGQSEQVALIGVQQGRSRALAPRISLAAAADTGASGPAATFLEVGIRRRSDGTMMWEGRAIDTRPATAAAEQRSAAVNALAAALFQDFPGISGRTIKVR
jgi:hypothetical protein